METVIITDSCCDLPRKFIDDNNIPFMEMVYNLENKEYVDDFGVTMTYKDFYDTIRQGSMSSTSQINVHQFVEEFKKHTNAGNSVIYLGLSSGLTGSLNNALIAKKTVLEENSNADITIIDSVSASLGEGLLIYNAYKMKNNGYSKDEIVDWLENNKLKLNHWFTVDSLEHLKRGGRISPTVAMVGSILSIKPILNVNDEGKLIPITKIKGRKKSLRHLANMLKENIVNPEQQVIAISHGDCLDDALYLKKILLEENSFQEIIINEIGPIIGSHTGPGAITVLFFGENR